MKTRPNPWTTFTGGSRRLRAFLPSALALCLAGAATAQDDNYEENDTRTAAYDLGSSEGQWLASIDGLGIQADQDWYSIEVAPGDHNVRIDCRFTHADGDIDIGLYDASGSALGDSGGVVDDEFINAYAPGTGTYYVVAYGADAGNTYDLWWASLPDDTYEENDTLGAAYDLTNWEGKWLDGLNGPGIHVAGDEDWYEIAVAPGEERVLVDCLFNHGGGDIDLALYDTSGTNQVGLSQSTDDNEHIDTVVTNGTYYIRVHFSNTDNPYNLRWDTVVPASCPEDDPYEPNDTLATAFTNLPEATPLSSVLGPGVQANEDWYSMDVAPGDLSVIVECTFAHLANNLGLRLWDSAPDPVGWAFTHTDDETIRILAPGPGRYYIQVTGDDHCATGSVYDLTWMSIVDDLYEDNDVLGAAYDLGGWEGNWLSALNGPGYQADDDWYRIEVSPGEERLLVDCVFSHGEGDIDLELYDAGGAPLTLSAGTDDNEHINRVVSNGTHYLKVTFGNATNRYDLWWDDVAPGACAVDDGYEENDTLASAYAGLPATTWLTEWSGPGVQCDEDWYRIEVPAGSERVLIDCLFQHQDGDIELELWNGEPTKLAGAYSGDNNEFIEVVVPVAGSHYIRVWGGDASNEYNLRWQVSPPGGYPGDDLYEENDSLSAGFSLAGSENVWLSALDGPGVQCDEDWYLIRAGAGHERVVVECVFAHAEGDIDIDLWDMSGRWLAGSGGVGDVEFIDYVVPEPGQYVLRIYNFGGPGQCNSYDLRWNDLARYQGADCGPAKAALFFDGRYVDLVEPVPAAEGLNVLAALTHEDLAAVTTFTGITAQAFNDAVADADLLYVPEFEVADLGADLDAAARGAISNYVAGGGCMILNGSQTMRSTPLVNSVFGFTNTGWASSSPPESFVQAAAAGTAFAGGPATLTGNNAVEGWDVATIPPGTVSVYEFMVNSNLYSSVAIVPVGAGRIVHLGFDWYNAVPLGTQDGGWHEVLERAVRECAGCPPLDSGIVAFSPTTGHPGMEVTVDTVPSHRYTIEYTDDDLAQAPMWQPFAGDSLGIGFWLEFGGFPSVFSFVDDYSPDTTGAEPVTGRRFYRAVRTFQCPIAMVGDTNIVHVVPGDPQAEATALQATIEELGYCANAFTGLTASAFNHALLNAETLIVPDQTEDGLSMALSPTAMGSISNFVGGGGRMIVHGTQGPEDADFVNAVFGYSVVNTGWLASNSTLTAEAAGTGFADGPAQLTENNATVTWDASTLPPGAVIVYAIEETVGTNAVATNATVVIIPQGLGKIIYLGWDWYDAEPLGSQDGGWVGILDTALKE